MGTFLLPPVTTLLSATTHSQPSSDMAPSPDLIFGEIQALDCGDHVYNIRQAIQLVQSVVAQVQGQ